MARSCDSSSMAAASLLIIRGFPAIDLMPPPTMQMARARRRCSVITKPTTPRLFGAPPITDYPKDGINDHVITGANTVNPDEHGTKACCGTRSRFPPEVLRRYASGSIDLINRHRPRMTNGMAATSRPSWQIGNGKRTSSTLPWHPMTSAMKRCECSGNRAQV